MHPIVPEEHPPPPQHQQLPDPAKAVNDARNWSNGTGVSTMLATGATALLFIAVFGFPILFWDLSQHPNHGAPRKKDGHIPSTRDGPKPPPPPPVAITTEDGSQIKAVYHRSGAPREFIVKVSYYRAWVLVDGTEKDYEVDDATCGRKSLVTSIATMHCLSFVPALLATIALWIEQRTRLFTKQVILMALSIASLMLAVHNIMLEVLRNKSNWTQCTTVVPHLEWYDMGTCWLMTNTALGGYFLALLVYIVSRYSKCCFYREDPEPPISSLNAQQMEMGTVPVGVPASDTSYPPQYHLPGQELQQHDIPVGYTYTDLQPQQLPPHHFHNPPEQQHMHVAEPVMGQPLFPTGTPHEVTKEQPAPLPSSTTNGFDGSQQQSQN